MQSVPSLDAISALVRTAVQSYARGFGERHLRQLDNPEGVLNMKIHNPFIAALGEEVQLFSGLMRSLDSSLGKMLEDLAMNIADLSFDVSKNVQGDLGAEQTRDIADLLEKYKRRDKTPEVADYQFLRQLPDPNQARQKRHDSDYYLIDPFPGLDSCSGLVAFRTTRESGRCQFTPSATRPHI